MTSKERPLIVYFSGTGQTEKLVNKINPDNSFETVRVKTGKEVINRDYILITPTYMKGEMPVQIKKLINNNHPPKEVIGTGNKQWGKFFCGAGRTISTMFNIPLIAKVEQSGHFNEVENILNYFKENYKVIGA
ncbi:MAG: class Ib ribonucleoside-diphosphate reductase assembly flavoprotein NrdI [Staphylococcus epidermidis]|nr:class Ib ribonucleoside-diphosphate reductase assembly flavoprotein NrdI [Staphylococcus epidermidis]